jgi:uncharacterized protein
MELQGERLIPASVQTTWAALNDPAVLQQCIAGCESMERTGDDSYQVLVAVVSARFKGNIQTTNMQPPHSYTLNFEGQGGVAGHGKGTADVSLTPSGDQTTLRYTARAQVGGKLAQVGSRLVDAAAAKIADDFFKAFEAHGIAPSAKVTTRESTPVSPASAAATPAARGGLGWMWWVVGTAVLIAIVYLVAR